jgi:hypothetical protein
VLVPAAAVLRHGGLELVVVRGDDGRASTRAVTVAAVRPVAAGGGAGAAETAGVEAGPARGGPAAAAGRAAGEPGETVEVLSGLAGGETVAVGLGALPPAGARLEAARLEAARPEEAQRGEAP